MFLTFIYIITFFNRLLTFINRKYLVIWKIITTFAMSKEKDKAEVKF